MWEEERYRSLTFPNFLSRINNRNSQGYEADRSFVVDDDDYFELPSQAVLHIYRVSLISERALCPTLRMHAHGASADRKHHDYSPERYARTRQ